jgi:hypothetical protein
MAEAVLPGANYMQGARGRRYSSLAKRRVARKSRQAGNRRRIAAPSEVWKGKRPKHSETASAGQAELRGGSSWPHLLDTMRY